MSKNHDIDFDRSIEKAIIFITEAYIHSGHNPKPALLHSIRVGMFLYNQNYDKEIVLGGLLHDLLEDTDISPEGIEKEFGPKVLSLVKANTFDISIENKYLRDEEMIQRCEETGRDALVIKAADIYDNNQYIYRLFEQQEEYKRVIQKNKYFLEITKKSIITESIYNLLQSQYDEILNK